MDISNELINVILEIIKERALERLIPSNLKFEWERINKEVLDFGNEGDKIGLIGDKILDDAMKDIPN